MFFRKYFYTIFINPFKQKKSMKPTFKLLSKFVFPKLKTHFLMPFGIVSLLFVALSSFLFLENQHLYKKDKDLEKLYKFLQGSYSSEKQAKADTAFFHITLQMFPIWQERKGEYWLYVEQARPPQKPYRQRIYRLARENGQLVSYIYTMSNPLRFAGAHKDKNLLKNLTPDSLELKKGCEVILQKTSFGFKGETKRQICPSELRKAKYATSEVILHKNKLLSWDRGFDQDDKQVWGAVKGGYLFDKLK